MTQRLENLITPGAKERLMPAMLKANMSKKEIYIKNIGNIILSKSKRAKRLTIRVKPFKGVFVTMPASISFKYAEKFVAEKKEWIKKSLLEIEKIEDKKTVFENNSIFNFHTNGVATNRDEWVTDINKKYRHLFAFAQNF